MDSLEGEGAPGARDPAFPPDLGVDRRPALWALGVLLALLAWALGLVFPAAAPDREGETPSTWSELEARVMAVASDPQPRPILFLGDSVVAGTMLDGFAPGARDGHRLVNRMRAQVAAGSGAGLHDLSWPGALPADLAEVRRLLDVHDPAGRVELVLELTPRYFSRAYAMARSAWSLPFLSHGPPWWSRVPGHSAWTRLTHGLRQRRGGLVGARSAALQALDRWVPGWTDLGGSEGAGTDARERALYRLRVRPHFLDLDLSARNPQVAALERVVAGPRRVRVFSTPIQEAFLVDAADTARVSDLRARMLALIGDTPDRRALDLDGEAFTAERFLDHCHLTPEGNDVLAAQLLRLLGLPSTRPLPRAQGAGPRPFYLETLVGGAGPGSGDGRGWDTRFRDPRDLVVLAGGDLAVADTGNHVLRRVRPGRHTSETWAGRAGHRGHVDGRGGEARLDTPLALAADPSGGVWVVDGGTDTLRHVDAAGRTTSVAPYDRPSRGPRRLRAVAFGRDRLWVADARLAAVVELDPTGGGSARAVVSTGTLDVTAMSVSSAGDLWLTTASGTVFRVDLRERSEASSPLGSPYLASSLLDALARWAPPGLPLRSLPQSVATAPVGPVSRVLPVARDGSAWFVADVPGERRLWKVDPAAGSAYAVWPANADGFRFAASRSGAVEGGIAAADPDSGDLYWLVPSRSLVVRWRHTIDIASWEMGDGGAGAAPKAPGAVRVAVFGSSMAGHTRGLADSVRTSLASFLDQRLATDTRLNGVSVDVVSRCAAGLQLDEALTGLLGQPEGSVQVALFVLDRTMVANLGESVPQLRTGPDGWPVFQAGPVTPLPIYRPAGTPGTDAIPWRQAVHRVLDVLSRFCAARGITPVFVDLIPLDEPDQFGLAAPSAQDPDGAALAEELAEVGIRFLHPAPFVAEHLAELHPVNGNQDHHLLTRGFDLLADYVSDHVVDVILEGSREGRAGQHATRDPSLDGARDAPLALLPPSVDPEASVPGDRVSSYREGSTLGILLDGTDLPWSAQPPGSSDLARRAAWAALRHVPRLGPAREVEVRVVTLGTRNEYGLREGSSTREVDRYRVDAGRLRRDSAALVSALGAPAGDLPAWWRSALASGSGTGTPPGPAGSTAVRATATPSGSPPTAAVMPQGAPAVASIPPVVTRSFPREPFRPEAGGDFESGTLRGWAAQGKAFQGQPVAAPPGAGAHGRWWVASHQEQGRPANTVVSHGDDAFGTLTSGPFRIRPGQELVFLLAGGWSEDTRAELLVDGVAVLTARGRDSVELVEVRWDLSQWAGKEARIGLVDGSSRPFGRVVADHFRLVTAGGAR